MAVPVIRASGVTKTYVVDPASLGFLVTVVSGSPTAWEWNTAGTPLQRADIAGVNADFVEGFSTVANPRFYCPMPGGYNYSVRAQNADGWSAPIFVCMEAQTGTILSGAGTANMALAALNGELVAELATYDPVDNPCLSIAGRGTGGDQGGGTFVQGAVGSFTVDYALVFPSSNPLFVWVRSYSGPLNVLWFGAYSGAPAAVNRVAMQAAIDASAGRGIFIPDGWYELDQSLRVCNFSGIIKGEGWGFPGAYHQGYTYGNAAWTDPTALAPRSILGTVLYFSSDTHGIDTITGDTPLNQVGKRPDHLTIKDLALIGPGGAGAGSGLTRSTTPVPFGTSAHVSFRRIHNVLFANWGLAWDATWTLWGQYDTVHLVANNIGFQSSEVFNANNIKNLTATFNNVGLDLSGMEINEIDGFEVNANLIGFRFGNNSGGGPKQLKLTNGYVEGNTVAIEAVTHGNYSQGTFIQWDNVVFDQPETWSPTGNAMEKWTWRDCSFANYTMRLGERCWEWTFPNTLLKDLQLIGASNIDPTGLRLSAHATNAVDLSYVFRWSHRTEALCSGGVQGTAVDTVITTVRAHGFVNGDEVFPVWPIGVPTFDGFQVSVNPAADGYQAVVEKTGYFVISATPTTFELALAPAGAALHFVGPNDQYVWYTKPAATLTLKPDWLNGPVQKVWLDAAAVTIEAPTNPCDGAEITFILQQDATGTRPVTWSPAYITSWTDVGNAANKRCAITFRYLDTGVWTQVTPQSPWLLRPFPFDWTTLAPASHPVGLWGAASYYDPVSGHVILFGGESAALTYTDKTWSFDPATNEWTDITPVGGPSARVGAGLVYDSVRGVGVLFGGADAGGSLTDTWEFDGTNWTEIFPATTPAGRYSQQLAFDSDRGVVVMYGVGGGGAEAIKTWEYDGVDWTLKDAVGITAVSGCILVYDPRLLVTVAWGGADGAGVTTKEIRHWNGTAWSANLNTATLPDQRAYSAATYDTIRGKIVIAGGYDGGGPGLYKQTWELTGTTWTRGRDMPGNGSRYSAFSFIPTWNEAVLFGGLDGVTYLSWSLLYKR